MLTNKITKIIIQITIKLFLTNTQVPRLFLNPKTAGGGQAGDGVNLTPPLCGFLKNVSSKEKEKRGF